MSSFKHSPTGFTLTESLMALTIAGTVLAAIAPLILISVGTRIQAYRSQQAMQIAQGEIDKIQVFMTQGITQDDELGKLPPPAAAGVKVHQVAAPTVTVTDLSLVDSPYKALEIDLHNEDNSNTPENENKPEFLVQVFRDQGIRFDQGSATDQLAVFRVGVRVYSGVAKENLGQLETQVANLNFTTSIGQQKTRPLAVLYTEVSRSDLKLSLQKYREYLDNQ